MTNFQDLSKIDQENFLMSKIIKALRKLGGKSFTKELSDEVVDATEEIPEEYAKLLIQKFLHCFVTVPHSPGPKSRPTK